MAEYTCGSTFTLDDSDLGSDTSTTHATPTVTVASPYSLVVGLFGSDDGACSSVTAAGGGTLDVTNALSGSPNDRTAIQHKTASADTTISWTTSNCRGTSHVGVFSPSEAIATPVSLGTATTSSAGQTSVSITTSAAVPPGGRILLGVGVGKSTFTTVSSVSDAYGYLTWTIDKQVTFQGTYG